MGTITIEIKVAELAEAVNNLALALTQLALNGSEVSKSPTVNSFHRNIENPTKTDCGNEEKADFVKSVCGNENKAERVKSESVASSDRESECSIEDIRAAFSAFAKKNGKDQAKEILAKYGASKVTEIKESDYNSVIQDIKQ